MGWDKDCFWGIVRHYQDRGKMEKAAFRLEDATEYWLCWRLYGMLNDYHRATSQNLLKEWWCKIVDFFYAEIWNLLTTCCWLIFPSTMLGFITTAGGGDGQVESGGWLRRRGDLCGLPGVKIMAMIRRIKNGLGSSFLCLSTSGYFA